MRLMIRLRETEYHEAMRYAAQERRDTRDQVAVLVAEALATRASKQTEGTSNAGASRD